MQKIVWLLALFLTDDISMENLSHRVTIATQNTATQKLQEYILSLDNSRLGSAKVGEVLATVEQFMDQTASPNVKATLSTPILQYIIVINGLWPSSTVEQERRVIQKMLANGAVIDATDYYNNTALLQAASRGVLPILEVLLEYGADPKKQNHWGMNAINSAEASGNPDAVGLLKSHRLKKLV